MKENRVLIGLGVFFLSLIVFHEKIVDKVADRVIQKLQREYSPSPYDPGIDPDRLDMQKIKNKK